MTYCMPMIAAQQVKSTVQRDVLDGILDVDDMSQIAKTEIKMQNAMDQVSQACDNYIY